MRKRLLAVGFATALVCASALPAAAAGGHTSCANIVQRAIAGNVVPGGPGAGPSGAFIAGVATSGPQVLATDVAGAQALLCQPK